MSKPRTRWYTTVSIVVMFLFSLTVTSAKAQSNPADLDGQSATTITKQLKNHQYDEQTLMQYTYQKINQQNPSLNNVIYQNPSDALKQLQSLQKTDRQQPFYGVPLLIKGLGQAYQGYPNTDGLPFLKKETYPTTKVFVKKLQKMGFVILGETNYPEMGLINITNSNLNGVAHNPWNLLFNTGGSSGGATASVAANEVPIATGNDAGGSLRIPASWSGVIGLKPTQGLIVGDSTTPSVVNFADTRDITDTQILLKGLTNPKQAQMLQKVPKNLKDLTIAYSLKSPVGTPVSQDAINAVQQLVNFLRQQGFKVVQKDSPVDGVKMMQTYYLGALEDGANASEKLGRPLTSQDVKDKLVSPMTYALYEASQKAPKSTTNTFMKELALVHRQMTAFHKQYPIYLTPTTATTAPLNSDPAYLPKYVDQMMNIKYLPFQQQMQLIYDSWLHGLTKTPFTQLANLAGEPALSLPTYVSPSGLPLGVQLQGSQGSDATLLAIGKIFEKEHQFKFLNANYPTSDASSQQTTTTTKSSNANSLKQLPQTDETSVDWPIYMGLILLGSGIMVGYWIYRPRR
ncbi:amidase family protein [Pediococcus acidilactici]|uniref:amidase family protein n=1 Tax=Pediococcus acidilactici TaxID=1254 RepID=UPI00132A0544|nr:amidase family protein [Pediococcus acidilactici]KAF0338394.1 LPXTG cell wall anchor domain-containing protein [Pediococcus acidilactici]KAF0378268.1 LPXTG cell wall anchor domain-containing protein [Pediococcus acidilactici]KAF0388823.1 LPXTG cell wall anchor domain-containing protein [Pediococcus acidilactici]KAF0451258.1 LPXTG cell wall anchor domain-containing protein [Pediococcus acidilactici]KAF0460384.1 LPXTG cell wall anchor domain-containing protein [Pediococcus acidilactici]